MEGWISMRMYVFVCVCVRVWKDQSGSAGNKVDSAGFERTVSSEAECPFQRYDKVPEKIP